MAIQWEPVTSLGAPVRNLQEPLDDLKIRLTQLEARIDVLTRSLDRLFLVLATGLIALVLDGLTAGVIVWRSRKISGKPS